MRGRERYVMLRHWLLESPAWKTLPAPAQSLYIQVAKRYNGSNNGRISYSVREGAVALNASKDTAARHLKILVERGFLICTKRGAFSLKTTKEASEWRLTEYDCDAPPAHATKEFMHWRAPEPDTNWDPKFKTRYAPSDHTVRRIGPHGTAHRTVNAENSENGTTHRTAAAKIDPSRYDYRDTYSYQVLGW